MVFLLDLEKEYALEEEFGWVYPDQNDDSSDFLYPPMRFSDAFFLWITRKKIK
jgi:hypothetical protein